MLLRTLDGLGLKVFQVTSDFSSVERLTGHTPPLTDLAEAFEMRRVLDRALRARRPRAILYSSATATFLQPASRLRIPSACWFDSPAAINRPGRRNSFTRTLERRSLRRMRLILPKSTQSSERMSALIPGCPPVTRLHVPIEVADDPPSHREQFALAYAGNPHKKGLDLLAAAWSEARPPLELRVAGIDADKARAWLRSRDVPEPKGVTWLGTLPREEYREQLRRAELFVSAARREEYGSAQLEAFADGAVLVSVPSVGPWEAQRMARALDARLVAREISSAGLAAAVRAACDLDASEQARYRAAAREFVRDYSAEAFAKRLAERVLPALMR